jgi:hypothetical protein
MLAQTDTYTKVDNLISSTQTDDELTKSFINGITPQWLRQNIEPNLDNTFAFINKKTNDIVLSVDITPFRANIEKQIPSGVKITIPDKLTFESYNKFIADLKTNYVNQGTGTTASTKDLASFDKQIKSSFDLKEQIRNNLLNVQKGVNYFKISSYIIIGLTLFLLIMIIVLARRSVTAIFNWTGQAIFYPSIIFTGILFGINLLINNWSPFYGIEMQNDTLIIVQPIYDYTIRNIIHNMLFYSIISVILGALLIIIAIVLNLTTKNKGVQNVQGTVK